MKSRNCRFRCSTRPAALASCNGWTEEVYRDLLALQEGSHHA